MSGSHDSPVALANPVFNPDAPRSSDADLTGTVAPTSNGGESIVRACGDANNESSIVWAQAGKLPLAQAQPGKAGMPGLWAQHGYKAEGQHLPDDSSSEGGLSEDGSESSVGDEEVRQERDEETRQSSNGCHHVVR
eukprot:1045176-Pelagomonas_calceolata.AAC.6